MLRAHNVKKPNQKEYNVYIPSYFPLQTVSCASADNELSLECDKEVCRHCPAALSTVMWPEALNYVTRSFCACSSKPYVI